MFAFYIKYGSEVVNFSGLGIEVPVMGCRRKPGKDLGETFEEQIEVILRGGPGAIDGWIRKMEALFTRIKLGDGAAFLWLQSEQRVTPLQSRIISGRMEFLGHGAADMKQGGMGVSVFLLRRNYWIDTTTGIELTNIHGNQVVGGLTVDNQYDSNNGKNNFVRIAAGEIQGELPAGTKISIKNLDSGRVISNIYMGLDAFYGLGDGEGWLEAENGASAVTFAVLLDPSANLGSCAKINWSSVLEVEGLYWTLTGDTVTRFGGRLVRPVMRLASLPGADNYWVRWAVKQGVAVEYSAWQQLDAVKLLQALPAIHIPPRGLGSLAMDSVRISLMVRRDAVGTHELKVDFVSLMAVDGFRHYSGVGNGGLAYNEMLVDSLEDGWVYTQSAGSELSKLTFQSVGKGIWLIPENEQCIRILIDEVGGGCRVDSRVQLTVYHNARRKNV
ncbi:MAG: hypothetical protein ACYDH1_01510 [Anaerolineaceae bacterium]